MGLPRPLLGLLLVGAAAGGPYFLSETTPGRSIGNLFRSTSTDPSLSAGGIAGGNYGWPTTSQLAGDWGSDTASGIPVSTNGPTSFDSQQLAAPAMSMPRIQALREVLRFDISPTWIPQKFTRVSTILGDTQLDGLRVPIVTGTSQSDLAGTLTYYFDKYKRVQRISIHAVTGDPSRFIAELQHAYQLQQQPSLGGGLYLLKWNGRATSVVYTEAASVISADRPYSRYNFFVELNQAGLEYGLSQEAQTLIATGQQTSRWQ